MAGERTKSTALLLVIAVFVLGIAVGALGMYAERNRVLGAAGHPRHQPLTFAGIRAKRVADLTQQLSLSPDQVETARRGSAPDARPALHNSRQENSQREQVSKQGRDQIRAFLKRRSDFEIQ